MNESELSILEQIANLQVVAKKSLEGSRAVAVCPTLLLKLCAAYVPSEEKTND